MTDGSTIGPQDDSFHLATNDDPWWIETNWFSFWVPERALSGTIYPWFRPNLGVAACAVAVWDDAAEQQWEVPYFDYQWQLPWPGGDLTKLELDNGLTITCVEPLRRYEIGYAHEGLELELRFDAVTEPHDVPLARMRFVGSAHFDQAGRVTGHMLLNGEKIAVDCYAMRDRSWGPRPDRGSVRSGYSSGTGSAGGFHSITVAQGDDEPILAGYLLRDGTMADLVKGTRRVERDNGRPTRVLIEGEDVLGRRFETEGRCANRLAYHARPNIMTWMSLTEWRFDNDVIWGEDQDVWSIDRWRDYAHSLPR